MSGRLTDQELRSIRTSVEWVGRLSDGLIKFGPLSLGLEGVLAWIPGLGEFYGLAAGGFLVIQAIRAGAPLSVIATAVAMLGLRSAAGAIPLAGAAIADVFTAHKWAAAMIVKSIDQQLSRPPSSRPKQWAFRGRGRAATA